MRYFFFFLCIIIVSSTSVVYDVSSGTTLNVLSDSNNNIWLAYNNEISIKTEFIGSNCSLDYSSTKSNILYLLYTSEDNVLNIMTSYNFGTDWGLLYEIYGVTDYSTTINKFGLLLCYSTIIDSKVTCYLFDNSGALDNIATLDSLNCTNYHISSLYDDEWILTIDCQEGGDEYIGKLIWLVLFSLSEINPNLRGYQLMMYVHHTNGLIGLNSRLIPSNDDSHQLILKEDGLYISNINSSLIDEQNHTSYRSIDGRNDASNVMEMLDSIRWIYVSCLNGVINVYQSFDSAKTFDDVAQIRSKITNINNVYIFTNFINNITIVTQNNVDDIEIILLNLDNISVDTSLYELSEPEIPDFSTTIESDTSLIDITISAPLNIGGSLTFTEKSNVVINTNISITISDTAYLSGNLTILNPNITTIMVYNESVGKFDNVVLYNTKCHTLDYKTSSLQVAFTCTDENDNIGIVYIIIIAVGSSAAVIVVIVLFIVFKNKIFKYRGKTKFELSESYTES